MSRPREENRRAYRDLLFTTPGVSEFISGVILYDETIRQRSADGTPFTKVLERQGIVPGIKVDEGAKALIGFPGEKITEGLDGLRGRLPEYRTLGARFAKWRAVIDIGAGIPDAILHPGQRARAGPIRRAMPGSGARPHRGTGGADGRGPHDRAVRGGDHGGALARLRGVDGPSRRPRGDAAEAQHGRFGERVRDPGGGGASRGSDGSNPLPASSRRPSPASSSSPEARRRVRPRRI